MAHPAHGPRCPTPTTRNAWKNDDSDEPRDAQPDDSAASTATKDANTPTAHQVDGDDEHAVDNIALDTFGSPSTMCRREPTTTAVQLSPRVVVERCVREPRFRSHTIHVGPCRPTCPAEVPERSGCGGWPCDGYSTGWS